MAEHVVTVTYDRKIIRRAVDSFVYHRLKFSPLKWWAVVGTGLWIYHALPHDADYFDLFIACHCVLGFYTVLVIERAKYQGLFPKCNDQTVVFKFSDNRVEVELPEAISELKWPLFNKVVKLKEAWLLLYDAKSRYIMLPTADLTPECMQFIEEKIGEVKRKDAV